MKKNEKLNTSDVEQKTTSKQGVSLSTKLPYQDALNSESFEDSELALEEVKALQDFRRKVSKIPFSSFHEIVETVTNLNKFPLSKEEKIHQTEILVENLKQRAIQLSPRVADLYLAIIAEIKGESYESKF